MSNEKPQRGILLRRRAADGSAGGFAGAVPYFIIAGLADRILPHCQKIGLRAAENAARLRFRISMVIPCCRTSMVSPGWMFSSRHNAAGIRTRRDVSTLHRTLFPAAVRICRSLLSGCTYISAIITRFSHKINTYCTKISAKDVLLVITEYEIALGKNIRKLRMERKLSQEQVSAQLQVRGCDVTRSALAKIEAGQRHLYPHELKALSIILAVPCDEILPNILE